MLSAIELLRDSEEAIAIRHNDVDERIKRLTLPLTEDLYNVDMWMNWVVKKLDHFNLALSIEKFTNNFQEFEKFFLTLDSFEFWMYAYGGRWLEMYDYWIHPYSALRTATRNRIMAVDATFDTWYEDTIFEMLDNIKIFLEEYKYLKKDNPVVFNCVFKEWFLANFDPLYPEMEVNTEDIDSLDAALMTFLQRVPSRKGLFYVCWGFVENWVNKFEILEVYAIYYSKPDALKIVEADPYEKKRPDDYDQRYGTPWTKTEIRERGLPFRRAAQQPTATTEIDPYNCIHTYRPVQGKNRMKCQHCGDERSIITT